MDEKEFKEFIDQLKEQGFEDEDILDVLFEAFKNGEIEREELDQAAKAMGYRAKEDFMNADLPEGKGDNDDDVDEDVTADQIEAAKEIKPGETEEEFTDRVEEGKTADEDEEEDDEEVDEDEERKEAMKYFGE